MKVGKGVKSGAKSLFADTDAEKSAGASNRGVDVQAYLKSAQVPAIIACTIRGKQGGTRALCKGRKSYRTTYTFSANNENAHTADLTICRVFTSAKRTKRLKKRAMWQIFILIHVDMLPKQVRRLYRKRFGIETSYRQEYGRRTLRRMSNEQAAQEAIRAISFGRHRVDLGYNTFEVSTYGRRPVIEIELEDGTIIEERVYDTVEVIVSK